MNRKRTEEINKNLLKESLIEDEVLYYLDENNIPNKLRKNTKYLLLVIDKLYAECRIWTLKEEIYSSFFREHLLMILINNSNMYNIKKERVLIIYKYSFLWL
ncbi:hypothetical protein C1146_15180 [Clostridium botulinum]|nr:hypothetical protein C1146_15180 [Clostridium botulinum]